jgi:uncharacterized membrane protein
MLSQNELHDLSYFENKQNNEINKGIKRDLKFLIKVFFICLLVFTIILLITAFL